MFRKMECSCFFEVSFLLVRRWIMEIEKIERNHYVTRLSSKMMVIKCNNDSINEGCIVSISLDFEMEMPSSIEGR